MHGKLDEMSERYERVGKNTGKDSQGTAKNSSSSPEVKNALENIDRLESNNAVLSANNFLIGARNWCQNDVSGMASRDPILRHNVYGDDPRLSELFQFFFAVTRNAPVASSPSTPEGHSDDNSELYVRSAHTQE